MRLPNGQQINGWWLIAVVLVLAFVIGLLPHAADLQWAQQK